MATITKIHFTISANGSPMAVLWIDDMDTTKDFEAIRIALKPQVAYLMFCGVGSEIEIKKDVILIKDASRQLVCKVIDKFFLKDNNEDPLFLLQVLDFSCLHQRFLNYIDLK